MPADWSTPNTRRRRHHVGALNRRRAVVPTEHREQAAVRLALQMHFPVMFEHLAAVPNGQLRDRRVAKKLKAEGQSNGYPDLLLDLPRGPFHGFRCEMKRQNAVPSDHSEDQRAWSERLLEAGYLAVVCRGAGEAFEQFKAYWELGPFNADLVVDLGYFSTRLEGRR